MSYCVVLISDTRIKTITNPTGFSNFEEPPFPLKKKQKHLLWKQCTLHDAIKYINII